MTELELLPKITIENGGEWWLLEEKNNTKLFKVVTKFQDGRYYNNPPTYQVFVGGKRHFVTTSYMNAILKFNSLKGE